MSGTPDEEVPMVEDKQDNVQKKSAPKHAWPIWWDGIDHPDVPFPRTKRVHGEYPTPDDILRMAEEALRIKELLATKCGREKAPEGLRERLSLEIRQTRIIREL